MAGDHEEEETYESGSSIPAFVLPFVTAGAALLVGALLGGLIIWLVKPPLEKRVEVPRDLTQQELEEVCAPFIIEKDDEVQAVQAKMVVLAKDLKEKRERLEQLEAEAATRKERGAGFTAELEKARRELAELKTELESVKAERDQLVEDLRKTIVQLEEAEARAEREAEQKELYKADALINKWKHFKSQSTVEVCDHGGRKKMGKCREKVELTLDDATWAEFKHCVLAGQEAPSVRLLEKDQAPPQFSRYLDQEDRITKDYVVLMCDPNLPEADLEHEEQATQLTNKQPI